MSPEAGEWRAFHVFYFDPGHVDELLVEAGKLMSALGPKPVHWFFIQYAEGGMHLRFRLRDSPSCYNQFLQGVRAKAWALAQSPGEMSEPPAGGFADERGHFHFPGSIVEIPYVPEIQRYGGPDALVENEALFAFSTSLALKLIGATLGDIPKRARLAIDLMLAAAIVAVEDSGREGEFFEAYSRFWASNLLKASRMPEGSRLTSTPMAQSRLQSLREFGESGDAPKSPSHLWLRRLAEARRRFQDLAASGKLVSPAEGKIVTDRPGRESAVSNMLMSQIHMLNNRLGIPPYLEMMWAAALARSLGR
ncbi:MAG TPA: lantibiotic dehydratase C-terminal domain-containing protein [Allosphingosinicella sp.]|jgi:thiopeptide-type bacteriocin biosynthesis protein